MFKKIFILSCLCLLVVMFSGCTSTAITRDASDIIVSNSRAAAKLEVTVGDLDKLISNSSRRLGDVQLKSKSIADGIDRTIYLFEEYEREVNRLLDEINKIRAEAKNINEDNSSRVYNSDIVNNN